MCVCGVHIIIHLTPLSLFHCPDGFLTLSRSCTRYVACN